MVVKKVLDTNIVLYFLGNKLAEPLLDGDYYVSVISEIELLSYASITQAEEESIQEFLSETHIVGVTESVKNEAVSLRRAFSLKIPDAIVAATAVVLGAELLTMILVSFE